MEGQRSQTVRVASPEAVTLGLGLSLRARLSSGAELSRRYQPCVPVSTEIEVSTRLAWPCLACAVPLPHGPKSRRPGCCCCYCRHRMAWHGPWLLQGMLSLGSTEARRLARPVSGLRCSGTLIVHTQHHRPSPPPMIHILAESCFSNSSVWIDMWRSYFPIGTFHPR